MKRDHVIRIGLCLIVMALLFPPWAHSQFRLKNQNSLETFGWSYCGHAFILSPPTSDREVEQIYYGISPAPVIEYPDMGIIWWMLALECLGIGMLAWIVSYGLTLNRRLQPVFFIPLGLGVLILFLGYVVWAMIKFTGLRAVF